MEIIDLSALISYIKGMKVVYPAVEWRITLNGKVQEVEEVEEDDEKENNNNARHLNASFMLIASVVFLYFYEMM